MGTEARSHALANVSQSESDSVVSLRELPLALSDDSGNPSQCCDVSALSFDVSLILEVLAGPKSGRPQTCPYYCADSLDRLEHEAHILFFSIRLGGSALSFA